MHLLMSTYQLQQPWIKKYMDPYIKATDRVVILPFSFSEEWIYDQSTWLAAYGPEGKYYHEIADQFTAYGIEPAQLRWLNIFDDPPETMRGAIMSADICFLTGGLPEKANDRIEALGLLPTLRQFKGHIIGASAGALIQLPAYYCSPDDDYIEFGYFRGLGLLNKPFYLEVHYNQSALQKDCILKALKDRTDEVYAIGDAGAILIQGKVQVNIGDVHYFCKD